MAKESSRTRRVGELIQVELAAILQREVSDSRFSLITITEVSVSPDLSFAKVFVSVLDEKKAKDIMEALNKAAKYFRFTLAQRVKLRIIPELRFFYDDTAVQGERISSLLTKVFKEKK